MSDAYFTDKELIDSLFRLVKNINHDLIKLESRLMQLEIEVRIGCQNRLKALEDE
jgi:hypothetical protein